MYYAFFSQYAFFFTQEHQPWGAEGGKFAPDTDHLPAAERGRMQYPLVTENVQEQLESEENIIICDSKGVEITDSAVRTGNYHVCLI